MIHDPVLCFACVRASLVSTISERLPLHKQVGVLSDKFADPLLKGKTKGGFAWQEDAKTVGITVFRGEDHQALSASEQLVLSDKRLHKVLMDNFQFDRLHIYSGVTPTESGWWPTTSVAFVDRQTLREK